MLTPIEVRKVRKQDQRTARLIFDEGGLFIAVDGESDARRGLVDRVLEAALAFADPPAQKVGPVVTPLSPVPLCHGNVVGTVGEGAREAIDAILRAAGYVTR